MGVEGPINQQQSNNTSSSALNHGTANESAINNTRRIETQAIIEPTNNPNNDEHQSLGERILATGKDLFHRAANTANSATEKLGNVLLPLDDMDDEDIKLVKSPEEQKGQIWQAGGNDNVPVPAEQLNNEHPTLMEKAGQAFEAAKQKCSDAVESVKSTFTSATKEGEDKGIESKMLEPTPHLERTDEFVGKEGEQRKIEILNRSNPSEGNNLLVNKDTKEGTSGIFVSKIGSTLGAVHEWEHRENIVDNNRQGEQPENLKIFEERKTTFEERQNVQPPRLDTENFPPLPGVDETSKTSEFQEEQQPLLQRELGAEESNRSWVDVVKSDALDTSEGNLSAGPGTEGATGVSHCNMANYS
jgi:hypothetical protein